MSLFITSVVPATDTAGTKIKAKSAHYGKSVTVAWDHSTGHLENHGRAAVALAVKLNATKGDAAVFRGPFVDVQLIGDAGRTVGYAYNARTADDLINPKPTLSVGICAGDGGTGDDRCGRLRDHAGPCDWAE